MPKRSPKPKSKRMQVREAPPADLSEAWQRTRAGTAGEHVYAGLLGLRTYAPASLSEQVARGVSYAAFDRLQRNTALSAAELAAAAGIPARTLARRKAQGRFDASESDRLLRLARVFARALDLFEGDAAETRGWLTSPALGLGGRIPLAFAATDVGAQEVERLISRIEHGNLA